MIPNGWWAGVPLGFESVERRHVSDTTRICVLSPMRREELLNTKGLNVGLWCARRAVVFIAISMSYKGLSNHKVHFEPKSVFQEVPL